MKKLYYIIFILILSVNCFSQSYLGYISKKTSMREGPGKDYSIILTLSKNTPIFIFSLDTEDGYYHIIEIESNTEGYIPSSNVKSIEKLSKSPENVFAPRGSIFSYNSEVYVYNNTSKTMTLKLNTTSYIFSPKESKTITLTPGYYDFYASAPGVVPNYGSKNFQNNMSYQWEFYIITKYYK